MVAGGATRLGWLEHRTRASAIAAHPAPSLLLPEASNDAGLGFAGVHHCAESRETPAWTCGVRPHSAPGGLMNALAGLTGRARSAEGRRAGGMPRVSSAEVVLHQWRHSLQGQRTAQECRLAQASGASRSGVHVASETQILAARLAGTRLLLAEVEAALARIAEGTYGRCTSCRDAIPSARLEVTPYVRCCVRCQRLS
jgi:RNA polymerase-binding transcription factor